MGFAVPVPEPPPPPIFFQSVFDQCPPSPLYSSSQGVFFGLENTSSLIIRTTNHISLYPLKMKRWENKGSCRKLFSINLFDVYSDNCTKTQKHSKKNVHCWIFPPTTSRNKAITNSRFFLFFLIIMVRPFIGDGVKLWEKKTECRS